MNDMSNMKSSVLDFTGLLEAKLKLNAISVVGKTGFPTTDMAYSRTGEKFECYGIKFKGSEIDELIKEWERTVEALVQVSKLRWHQRYRNFGDKVNPVLHWRIKPQIDKHPEEEVYTFRTRLLVTCHSEVDT